MRGEKITLINKSDQSNPSNEALTLNVWRKTLNTYSTLYIDKNKEQNKAQKQKSNPLLV